MKKLMPLFHLIGGTIFLTALAANGQLINGTFATGDFTGWTYFNTVGSQTPYGLEEGGTSVFQVAPFDIAGTGSAVNCAEFEVGEASGIIGGGGLGQGAGIYQNVALGAGTLNLSLNIAALSLSDNGDAGTFELLLNGNVVDSDAMGGISANQVYRSTLDYSTGITAGTYEVGIDIRRGGGSAHGDTPFEYLSNVQLSVTPVPEPSIAAIGGGALLALFFYRRGVRRTA
jgi:hypothetical protein